LTILRLEDMSIFEIQQGLQILDRLQDHRTTISAIAPGWPSGRNILLPPKGHNAVAAFASANFNFYLVNELHDGWS
jgi:hypothetical protein